MMPVKLRLHLRSHSDFFRWQRRWYGKHCTIYWKEQSSLQAAFVVGKKVAAAAVQRNRIKRLLRHAVIERSSFFPSVAIVLVAKKNVGNVQITEYSQDVESFIRQLPRVVRK